MYVVEGKKEPNLATQMDFYLGKLGVSGNVKVEN